MNCIRNLGISYKVSEGNVRRARWAATRIALTKLSEEEQAVIAKNRRILVDSIPNCGEASALEALAALGMFLNERGISSWKQIPNPRGY